MDYLILFIIILITALVIIQITSFKVPTISWSWFKKSSTTSTEPKCTKLADGTIFCTGLEEIPKCKFNPLDKSEISEITIEVKKPEEIVSDNVKKENDYYFIKDNKESQVYHVFNNIYTFQEAKDTCEKRGGRLATPEELKAAEANWCSWGWTSDGVAYMPNKDPKCNKEVGLLSAGNIDNFLRLGANCYGTPK
jgi:hypothetical protein